MKVKNQQIIKNCLSNGLIIERVSPTSLEIKGSGEIPISILLPENFELQTEAVEQLIGFAHLQSASGKKMKCACATPDFHKGTTIPVGSVVVSDKDIVVPSAIGTDINCGMRLHHSGLTIEQFLSKKEELINLLKGDFLEGTRDIPTSNNAMMAMFSDGLGAFWNEMKKTPKGIFNHLNYEVLSKELNGLHFSAFEKGNLKYAPENLMNREWMRDPALATIGASNHFCEIQVVKEIVDRKKAYEFGLKVGHVVVMIHSGSRDVGFYVGNHWMERAKQEWPKDMKHPANKAFALEGELAKEYLSAMTVAAHYATTNRALLSEIVRQRIAQVYKKFDNHLIIDVPHNIVIQEDIGNVHRKGATPAHEGDLLLIPGSMGAESYLLNGLGNEKWINSASHGAGRSLSRNQMSFKGKKDHSILGLDGVRCITLKEERMIEEAPSAYKEIGPVISSQEEEKTVSTIAVFSPLVTFKA